MKILKFFSFLGGLTALGCASFYITYEKVSAIVMEEEKEYKKNEVVFKTFINEIEDEKSETEQKAEEVAEKKETLNVNTDNFIFVGDSRIEDFKSAYKNIGIKTAEFITTENPDYYWMVNMGADSVDSILKNKPGKYNIVFNIGINDLNNAKMYIDFLNHFAHKYPNQNIFVLTIGPLDELKAAENDLTHINNDDIYDFNINISKNLNKNVHVIQVFQELIVNGYDTVDGYYLTKDTSKSLLKFIKEYIKQLQTN